MKIPRITASQELPMVHNIRVPRGAFTQVAEGYGQLGGALGQMGEDWYQVSKIERAIEKKKREFDNVTTTMKLTGELKDRVDEIHREIENYPSSKHADILKDFDRKKNLISNEMQTKALLSGGDVYDLFGRESIGVWTNARIQAKAIQDLKWKDDKVAELNGIQNRLEDDAAQLIASGKSPAKATEFYEALLQKAQAEGIVSSVQTEKRREILSDRITAKVKALQEAARKQDEKEAETRADIYLTSKYGTNYDEMIEALKDPKVYAKQLGLTVQQASNLTGILKNRKTKETETKEEMYKQMANNYWLRLKSNSLSKEDIREGVEVMGFPWNLAESFEKAIDKQIEAPDGKVKTDKGTYSRLLSLAWSHPDKEYVRREVLKNVHLLEDPDFERLLQTNETKADARWRESVNIGKNLIEKTVIPKRGLMASYLSTPKEEEDLANALTAFNDAIINARKANPNIQSDEIRKIADQVSRDYSKSLAERLTDFTKYTTEQFKKDVQKTVGGKPGEKPKVPKMTDEQIRDYLLTNGYLVTDENVRVFKEDNGMK